VVEVLGLCTPVERLQPVGCHDVHLALTGHTCNFSSADVLVGTLCLLVSQPHMCTHRLARNHLSRQHRPAAELHTLLIKSKTAGCVTEPTLLGYEYVAANGRR
jgi:hypothetical protein